MTGYFLKLNCMKKVLCIVFALLIYSAGFSQAIRKVTINYAGAVQNISVLVDGSVIINFTTDGKIMDWGIENNSVYNYQEKIDKYMGRVDYYTANDNPAYTGKVKYIGRTLITYYTSSENESWQGKLKSIGMMLFNYYDVYDDEIFRDKIKNAGAYSFSWFGSIDNEGYRGKLKTLGSTAFTYFASYDDKAFKGKIKSIGSNGFTYYSSYDKPGYSGAMKTGNRITYMNGIRYLVGY